MLRELAPLALSLVLVAGVAHASDGRLEINQSCVATGCFPGDAVGFPVETQAATSYVLTSNLVVPTAATNAITLAAQATLDLNGFSISGVTSCTGTPVTSCTPTAAQGQGMGVYAESRATIRNGTIRKVAGFGIAGGGGLHIDSVLIEEAGGDGIYLNYSSDGPEGHLIQNCRIVRNGGSGIFNSGGSGGVGALITGNVILGNKNAGYSGFRALLTNNTFARNTGPGTSGSGGSPNAIGGNSFLFNNGGNDQPQTGTEVQIAPNLCGVDTTCP